MGEHYRSETEAALQRLSTLERENERLRAALDERGIAVAQDPGAREAPARGGGALVVIFAIPVLGALTILFVAVWLVVAQ